MQGKTFGRAERFHADARFDKICSEKGETMAVLNASIMLVGDELLSGDIADRNGPFFAERLTDQGFQVRQIRILPDETKDIADALRNASNRCRVVLVCGGLGPTSDDRTTQAVSQAFRRERILDPEHWERLRQIFSVLRGTEPPPGNEKQAMFPKGAHILPNEMGTAPGYAFTEGLCTIAVLPGPPRENRPMFDKALMPWLDGVMSERSHWISRVFRVFGLAESEVGSRLAPLEKEYSDLRVSYRFSFPEILVKLRCEEGHKGVLTDASDALKKLLEPHIYSTGAETLPTVLGKELAARGLRVVTAESCTGGLAAKLLTDTPGSSTWMERGFVTYSNAAKEALLGVSTALLEKHGAVSEPVAHAMLEGALERSEAPVGIAITGVAGPEGGTLEKPVGTVCTAWGRPGDLHTRTYPFRWDREYNRIISAWAAMHQLYLYVRGG